MRVINNNVINDSKFVSKPSLESMITLDLDEIDIQNALADVEKQTNEIKNELLDDTKVVQVSFGDKS